MKIDIRIKKLHEKAIVPAYATEHSAGVDLCAIAEENIIIKASERAIVPTGIAIALPEGYEAQVRPRSGLAAKSGVTVLNTPGTIDADYRGEIKIILINHGSSDFIIENGMRIAQLVISRHNTANFILNDFDEEETNRGTRGFGSTGAH